MSPIEALVQEFATAVAAQTVSLRDGDAESGNKHAQRYTQAFARLRQLGDQGRDALVPLMSDSRDDVREMAAAFLLRHRHDEARRVLEELSSGQGLVAFGASEALKRWQEGTWQLDLPD